MIAVTSNNNHRFRRGDIVKYIGPEYDTIDVTNDEGFPEKKVVINVFGGGSAPHVGAIALVIDNRSHNRSQTNYMCLCQGRVRFIEDKALQVISI